MGNKMNTVREKQVGSPQGKRISLAERIARWSIGVNGLDTPIAGLTFHRWKMPTEPTSYALSPSICLIGQGQKRLFLVEETYVYDEHRFLVSQSIWRW